MTVVRNSPSGINVDIAGQLALAFSDLPDASGNVAGVAGTNIVYRDNVPLTAPRTYTVQVGTAVDGDQMSFVLRNIAFPVTVSGVPGSGGITFPASTGEQSLVLQLLGGVWTIIESSSDTQTPANTPPLIYFGDAVDPTQIPAAVGGGFDVMFAQGLEVVNDNDWLVFVCLHAQSGVGDSLYTFELQLDDGINPRTVLTTWSELYSAGDTAPRSRTIQQHTLNSGGVADGTYDLYVVCTANGGGVALDLSYPTNVSAQVRTNTPS